MNLVKKIILYIIFLFIIFPINIAFCDVNFLYTHGSYEEGVDFFNNVSKKLHKNIEKELNKSEVFRKNVLGNKKINSSPLTYYWGEKTLASFDKVNKGLDVANIYAPKLADFIKVQLAHLMHDTVWISFYPNMLNIVEDINNIAINNYNNKNSLILLGYSSGALITYNYLLFKIPYINTQNFFDDNNISNKNTCLGALIKSNSIDLDINWNLKKANDYKQKLKNIDCYTKMYCNPNNINGVINFGAPILFFQDEYYKGDTFKKLNDLLIKYIIENDMFFLTVNYKDDPFSVITPKNFEYSTFRTQNVKNGSGFIYEYNNFKSYKTFLKSHNAYWTSRKQFAKNVKKAYEEGFINFYNK